MKSTYTKQKSTRNSLGVVTACDLLEYPRCVRTREYEQHEALEIRPICHTRSDQFPLSLLSFRRLWNVSSSDCAIQASLETNACSFSPSSCELRVLLPSSRQVHTANVYADRKKWNLTFFHFLPPTCCSSLWCHSLSPALHYTQSHFTMELHKDIIIHQGRR